MLPQRPTAPTGLRASILASYRMSLTHAGSNPCASRSYNGAPALRRGFLPAWSVPPAIQVPSGAPASAAPLTFPEPAVCGHALLLTCVLRARTRPNPLPSGRGSSVCPPCTLPCSAHVPSFLAHARVHHGRSVGRHSGPSLPSQPTQPRSYTSRESDFTWTVILGPIPFTQRTVVDCNRSHLDITVTTYVTHA